MKRAGDKELRTTDGIIIVDKESGTSSFKIVEEIKKILKVRKAGHAGTLDPFANGILLVLLNQGTKLSPFLMSQDKVYRATLRLGIETDTQDLTGNVIKEKRVGELTTEKIKEAALQYIGTITQVPPLYSAVHHKGKRAYELARNGVAFAPQEREVRIDYIHILSVGLPTVGIEVGCSSGTYIRTLAADLGRSLGTGAHLSFLRRIKSGPFHIDNSSTVAQIVQHLSNDTVEELILPLKDALKGMVEVEVSDSLARKIRNGYQPQKEDLSWDKFSPNNSGRYIKAVKGKELVAILKGSNGRYEVGRVFT
jgi:tRNA pseudouridine55 synthase